MSVTLTEMHAPDPGAVEAIVRARHGDPFAVLGPHEVAGGCAIRSFLPGAIKVEVPHPWQVLLLLPRVGNHEPKLDRLLYLVRRRTIGPRQFGAQ